MNTNLNDAVQGLAEWMEIIKNKIENEGGKFYLMGLAADVKQLTETLHAEVLERVRQEATLDVDEQLNRRHRDEEYACLYEQEKRRYMNSGTAKQAKSSFEDWKESLGIGCASSDAPKTKSGAKICTFFI